jgi:hypothetical protein
MSQAIQQPMDFSACQMSFKGYHGADEKRSILIDGRYYMLKISEELDDDGNQLKRSFSAAPLSEHIACAIFASVGIPTQKTLLGTYNGRDAVACEDFIVNDARFSGGDWQLQEFSELENSIISSSERGRTPILESVEFVLNSHPRLEPVRQKAIERFWDTLIVDALIGNFDRHAGNWGYIVNIGTGEIYLAPVYDCGSSLFPKLSDAKMPEVMLSEVEVQQRIFNYPRATLLVNSRRASYSDLLKDKSLKNCQAALARIYPRIDMEKIASVIAETPLLSQSRRDFLLFILKRRYSDLLTKAVIGQQ